MGWWFSRRWVRAILVAFLFVMVSRYGLDGAGSGGIADESVGEPVPGLDAGEPAGAGGVAP